MTTKEQAQTTFERYGVRPDTLNPAYKIIEAIIDEGAEAPGDDVLQHLDFEESDGKHAMIHGSTFIVDICNKALQKKPEDERAKSLLAKWQPISRDVDKGIPPGESVSQTLYECMKCAAEVYQWQLMGVSVQAEEWNFPVWS